MNMRQMLLASVMALVLPVMAVDGATDKKGDVTRNMALPSRAELLVRPSYHFHCANAWASPGDPNGAFFAKGRYHLMYLYRHPTEVTPTDGRECYHWGHVSSRDLVRWIQHPDAIGKAPDDAGAFSGGAFLDDDGTCYLSYWMIWGAKGVGLVRSVDGDYVCWERCPSNPAIPATAWGYAERMLADGKKEIIPVSDPSNIWKKEGRYYMLCGNYEVLHNFGWTAESPDCYRGDHLGLFASDDLKSWRYVHDFYMRRTDKTRASGWTDPDEDNMCPVFLSLPSEPTGGQPSGKHLLTFISHNRGCQYYIGTYDRENDRFLPESHGRMTWRDKTYFAPEAMLDGKGRQLLWTWLNDDLKGFREKYGWCGTYALPRTLWLRPDGTLGVAPVEELKALRGKGLRLEDLTLNPGSRRPLAGIRGDCCELELTIPHEAAGRVALDVRADADSGTRTTLGYDEAAGEIYFDATAGGSEDITDFCGHQPVERAPFRLSFGEDLVLRVFVDGPVVEVFANDRQAISRRVYAGSTASGVFLLTRGAECSGVTVRAWNMSALEIQKFQAP